MAQAPEAAAAPRLSAAAEAATAALIVAFHRADETFVVRVNVSFYVKNLPPAPPQRRPRRRRRQRLRHAVRWRRGAARVAARGGGSAVAAVIQRFCRAPAVV